MLRLTFTSVTTAGLSAYLAVTSEAAQAVTAPGDIAAIAAMVAVTTFAGAKLGKYAGGFLGFIGGAGGGAAAGATMGGVATGSPEGAGAGGVLGGLTLGVLLGVMGAIGGYGGGAYLGHKAGKKIALEWVAPEKNNIPVLPQKITL